MKTKLSIFIIIALLMPFVVGANTPSFVMQNGQIQVKGTQLVNKNKQAIQLRGVSSHGLQWYGQYVNKDTIEWLKKDWGITVFRAAMYVEEDGYISSPKNVKTKMKEAIQAAIDSGIYVIVDWHMGHEQDPNIHKKEAIAFFKEIATAYGKYPNVIYEICNEPNGQSITWNKKIKPYAEELTKAIRTIDKDNIILVGTGTWSQDVDAAADNPLKFSNIMYVAHFYAGTHGQFLKDKITYAMKKGAPVFVSEWGTSKADGNGGVYKKEATAWLQFLNQQKISWVNWNLSDKNESSALLAKGASVKGGWTAKNLSPSGQFVKAAIKTK